MSQSTTIAATDVTVKSHKLTDAPKRLYSLDALRGFDMFWIMGAEEIVNTMSRATGNSFWNGFANQLTHPDWNGFHFYDLIFPLFLFIAGVATRSCKAYLLRKKIWLLLAFETFLLHFYSNPAL